jgi:hypothetical protein
VALLKERPIDILVNNAASPRTICSPHETGGMTNVLRTNLDRVPHHAREIVKMMLALGPRSTSPIVASWAIRDR